MFVLALLTSVVLRAFSAQAEVVDNFKDCERFFYKQTKPGGMDQNTKEICQKYKKEGSITLHSYYATLYSPRHRIPLYSAYTFDPNSSSGDRRKDDWHVEPQISEYQTEHMVLEKLLGYYQLEEDQIKRHQAMSSDYCYTGYDRGHLNPNSFQSGDGRLATFTLTNAAPMDPCFNRIQWYNWEKTLKMFLKEKYRLDGSFATAYIVTGTVPDANKQIPEEGTSENSGRVTVPSHIWTAVCYKHHTDDRKSLSFSYMAENKPEESDINLKSVSYLNNQLSRLYSELSETQQSVKIFVDNCFEDNNKLEIAYSEFKKLMNPLGNKIVHMSSDAQNTFRAVKRAASRSGRQTTSKKNFRVSQMTAKLAFDSMSTYFTVAEDLKDFAESACLITHAKPPVKTTELTICHDELRKREVSEVTDAVECLLVPEKQKTAADGSRCSTVSESSDSCICNSDGKIKPCCSTPCLYQDSLDSYRCYSGKTKIPCSPRYSLITANGKKCIDAYPCATYGYDYYWCYITEDYAWEICSPPLKKGEPKDKKYCCSQIDKGNNNKYCTSDDCFSTVTDTPCRSDHKCGYHGFTFLWCYTDYKNNWEKCCTNCTQ